MKIHENTALLDAFVDGELPAADMAEVRAHLAECPDCRAYVEDALAIRAAFPTEEEPELPADFYEHVMEAVAKAPRSKPKRQPWGKLAAAAACLAVIVLVQHGVGMSRGDSNEAAVYTADCAVEESVTERGAAAPSAAADSCQPMETANGSSESDAVSDAAGEGQTADKKNGADGTFSTQSTVQNAGSTISAVTADDKAELPTVQISAAELGDLLDDRVPTEQKDSGVIRYLLTREEFNALAAELSGRGVVLETEDAGGSQLWLEVLPE